MYGIGKVPASWIDGRSTAIPQQFPRSLEKKMSKCERNTKTCPLEYTFYMGGNEYYHCHQCNQEVIIEPSRYESYTPTHRIIDRFGE